jgi:hypothetical protein
MEILGKALADLPWREEARLPFFRAAASLHEDELALASIEQILGSQVLSQRVPQSPGEDEMISAEEEEPVNQNQSADEHLGVSPTVALPPAQLAQLAHEVGLALIRLDRLDEAASYLQIAQKWEKAPSEKKRVTVKLLDVRARLRRQRANAARQPILHAELEQDRLVRPRLLARAATPARASAKAEVKP